MEQGCNLNVKSEEMGRLGAQARCILGFTVVADKEDKRRNGRK